MAHIWYGLRTNIRYVFICTPHGWLLDLKAVGEGSVRPLGWKREGLLKKYRFFSGCTFGKPFFDFRVRPSVRSFVFSSRPEAHPSSIGRFVPHRKCRGREEWCTKKWSFVKADMIFETHSVSIGSWLSVSLLSLPAGALSCTGCLFLRFVPNSVVSPVVFPHRGPTR